MSGMAANKTIELPITGMDCMECTAHVQQAIQQINGVYSVDVLLAAQKAIIQFDPVKVKISALHHAVVKAGYSIPIQEKTAYEVFRSKTRRILTVLGLTLGAILFLVIGGEVLGLFEKFTDRIPSWVGAAIVITAGLPLLIDVLRAAFHKQIISHTLMIIGVIASLLIGEWVTAGIVVFLMHIGKYIENFTTGSTRKAVRDLSKLMPSSARIEKGNTEIDVPVEQVKEGDVIVIRPGETIPVDGMQISGNGTVNQSAITGESMPVEVQRGMSLYAGSMLSSGSVRIQAVHTGKETTLGKIIKMVEEAEAKQGTYQKFADKFSAFYLPVVAFIALLTWLVGSIFIETKAVLNATGVLVVACSCSIALATPIAMLASIGAAAKKGLLIRGGKFIEIIEKADVVLIDKTGTLTLGKPRIDQILLFEGHQESHLIEMAVSAERYSEHPLAQAVRDLASEKKITAQACSEFEIIPGVGVAATINDHCVRIGNTRIATNGSPQEELADLEQQSASLLYVYIDDKLAGVLVATDTLRFDVPAAIHRLKKLGIQKIELLTGDKASYAQRVAEELGIGYRAELLPAQKIDIVKEYQSQGHKVVMIGDGINDAPALAQADIGIAMGENGTEIASETADIVLMREDWHLIPSVFEIGRRTMKVVKMNLIFTGVYNIVGISLAAFGIITPVLAAALQSIPDLGILGNSSWLLKQRIITNQSRRNRQLHKSVR